MMMNVEKSVEKLAGITEVLDETPQQFHFVHHKSHITLPGSSLGLRE
jgi:hypothetical protein